MNKRLVIFGLAEQAQLAHYFFSHDSEFEVVAFTADRAYTCTESYCDLPVVPFDEVVSKFSPKTHSFFVALGYSRVNQLRKEKYFSAKDLGYQMASYISSRATLLNDGHIGENCFLLEDNTIQPFVQIGNNVTLWSGNHIGHHSIIGDHCFLTSHVVVSGGVNIGDSCFLGVNSTLRDHITIGEKCVIGAGALILEDAAPEGVYIGSASERAKVPSTRLRSI